MKYNLVNAIAYEITNLLISVDTHWEMNPWVKMIRTHSLPDWVEWKTEQTMKNVDTQIEEIKTLMQEQDYETYIKPVITEHEPDGSKAQELLGGALEIKAPWSDTKFPDTHYGRPEGS